MDFGSVATLLVITSIALLAVILRRRRAESEREMDAGSALLEFGSAFPDVAVRDVVRTADGRSTFLRLADGRTGLVRVAGSRQSLRIIAPGDVGAEGPVGEGGRGIRFAGGKAAHETFLFERPEDAAEVLLWLNLIGDRSAALDKGR